jgi:hypothetical protein
LPDAPAIELAARRERDRRARWRLCRSSMDDDRVTTNACFAHTALRCAPITFFSREIHSEALHPSATNRFLLTPAMTPEDLERKIAKAK